MPSQNEDRSYEWFVGIDWATAGHQVCVLDATGAVRAERAVAHTAPALTDFVDALARLTGDGMAHVAVSIEVPRGAVVETLLERGAAVFTINPKQVDRFRDRFTVAGAKDDRRDALVLASALRTDPAAFRRVAADDPRIIQLREIVRADEDLADEFNRLGNRLREQVYRLAPTWLTLAPNAAEPWFWAVVERLVTRPSARHPSRAVLARVLRAHRIRRVTADEVYAAVTAPVPHTTPGTAEAARTHIQLLLPRLRLVHAQRRTCERALDALLAALGADPEPPSASAPPTAGPPSDVTIARSLPGIGRRVLATLLAEAAPILQHRNGDALRALAGLAPVTRQSGTRRTVGMRYACNRRLRDACYHWARTSTLFDPAAKAYYTTLRSRGHSHGRALRSVADRGLRILLAMLRSGTCFDPGHPAQGQPVAVPA
jgi:transposase